MKNELNYEQETVRSVFGAYINDLKAYSSKPDRPTIRKLEEVRDKAIKALESQEDVMKQKMFSFFDGVAEGLKSPLESTVIIPSGATNGDVIKAVFGAKITTDESYGFFTDLDDETYFSRDWWLAPYKEDKVDDEDDE